MGTFTLLLKICIVRTICVKIGSEITPSFKSYIGVRQGYVLRRTYLNFL